MNIKQKLHLLSALIFTGFVSVLVSSTYIVTEVKELEGLSRYIDRLEVNLLNLRSNEKDFLFHGDMKYLDKFNEGSKEFIELDREVAATLEKSDIQGIESLESSLIEYRDKFSELVKVSNELGFSGEDGFLGEYKKILNRYMQNEMLSAGKKVAMIKFDLSIMKGIYPDVPELYPFSDLLNSAKKVSDAKQVIGIDYDHGLMGEVREQSHAIEKNFSSFYETITKKTEERTSMMILIQSVSIVVILLIILPAVFFANRSLNNRIANILSVMKEISSTNNIGIRIKQKGKDELVVLGDYFNEVLGNIENLISSSQKKSSALSNSTVSMHKEINSVIQNFSAQSEFTSMMAVSTQEMVSTIAEIAESTAVAVDSVQKAASNAENGREAVKSSVKNVKALSNTLELSQTSISALNAHVEKVGGAVNIIQNIAEQTNLLALNAAIEAARAGESGRGFAVVADEVRTLATRTHNSTEDIKKVVSDIQSQMDKVVQEINQCNNQGQAALSDSIVLDASLERILLDMTDIQANSERIASAIEEQGMVMEQVGESINELNELSEENMKSAKHVMVEVDEISAQAKDMDLEVSKFIVS